MATIAELDTPALVVELDALERNLTKMDSYFAERRCKLRPHAKTHKCGEIACRQMDLGAIGITCAKLGEAEAMARAGVRDILIANQVVAAAKLRRLAALAGRCRLTVAIDDLGNARQIARAACEAATTVGVLIEIDVGMGRCGVAPDRDMVVRYAQELSGMFGLEFRGLMGYEGHAVMIEDPEERRRVAQVAVRQLLECVAWVREAGLGVPTVSAGGTGTYDITSQLEGVTEVQAGSYALMDARYRQVRPEFENALFVVATVISRPAADRVVLDAGLKSITQEFGLPVVVRPVGLEVIRLSEEHVRCRATEGARELKIGDQVWLLPTHCCTTVNLHDRYWIVQQGRLVATWPIEARGRFA